MTGFMPRQSMLGYQPYQGPMPFQSTLGAYSSMTSAGNYAGGSSLPTFNTGLGFDSFSSNYGGMMPQMTGMMGGYTPAISSSTLQLMANINLMMASVMQGLTSFIQMLMQSNQQRQGQSGINVRGTNTVPNSSYSSPTSSPTPSSSSSSSSNTKNLSVDQAIDEAIEILIQNGIDPKKINKDDIRTIIEHESGGNPNAQNNWDSNAKKGTPSIGLMQTIQPTFDAYKLSGHNDIRNPVDNIIAGVRYSVKRYGSTSNVPGVRNLRNGKKYVGY